MKLVLSSGRVTAAKKRIERHGMTGTPEHKMRRNILQRCGNPRNPDYPNYGARLKPCIWAAWKRSLKVFIAYVGKRPGPGYSINRIDNSKGYVPGNVEWSTAKVQAANRRSTRTIEYGGIIGNVTEWSEVLGLRRTTLQYRLSHGWTMERILADVKAGLEWKKALSQIKSKALVQVMFGRRAA